MLTYDFFDVLHRQVIHFRRPGKDAAATSQSRGIKFQQLHDSGGPVADSSFPLKQMHLLKLQLDAFSFRASAEKAHWLLAVALQDP